MEATDLRIGDWVYDTMDGNKTPCRISLDDFKDEAEGLHPFSVFNPIPLTEDILRKNFNICKDATWDGLRIKLFKGSGYYESDISVEIHYVHEFQHALRLCGLNDLAANFKLE